MSSVKRRNELTERIAFTVQRVREYGDGSPLATRQARDYCRQIYRDAAELEELLEERLEVIQAHQRPLHGVPRSLSSISSSH